MTPAMKRAFDWIVAHVAEHGRPPSLRLLAGFIGCTLSGAQDVVARLIERGHLARGPDQALALGAGLDRAGHVFVALPVSHAMLLAQECRRSGDTPAALLADAVLLLCDQRGGAIGFLDDVAPLNGEAPPCG